MNNESNLGEQALEKVAEIAILSKLDKAEEVNINIQTDPINLLQGKVDSVAIAGEGMIMKQDLRIECLEVNTTSVAVNPFKAMLGQIELTQSLNAVAQIILTEEDLNRALKSDYLSNKMKNLKIPTQKECLIIDIQQAHIYLGFAEKVGKKTGGNFSLFKGVIKISLCFSNYKNHNFSCS